MASTEPPDPTRSQGNDENSSLPSTSHNSGHIVNVDELCYTDGDYLNYDEDETPATPSAGNTDDAETPNSKRVREDFEARKKPSQPALTSSRLQAPIVEINFEELDFSFMPVHQQQEMQPHKPVPFRASSLDDQAGGQAGGQSGTRSSLR